MPQDNMKDNLETEGVVVAGGPLEAALSMKVAAITLATLGDMLK